MKRSRVLLAGLLVSWSATAQPTPEQSRVSTAVDVTIQNLDVVVTDAKGNPVHRLSVDDFELKQDGRPVRITNFQEVGAPDGSLLIATAPEAPGGGAGAPADGSVHTNPEPARPNRHIVLFLASLRLPEPDQRMAKEILASIVQAANAQGVTLYTVRTAGMESATVSAASSPAENPGLQSNSLGAREQLVWANDMEALDFVAKETGGLSTGAVSRLETLTDRVTSDLASWYSLGFPTNRKPGDSSISVHVKDSKLKVRVRRSLVVKTVEDQMKDRVLANLFRQDERSVLPITVVPRPGTAKKNRYSVPIEVRIPINSLVLLPKGEAMAGAFSVFVATAGSKGDFSEPVRQTRPFEIARRDLEKAKLSYFTYQLEVVTSSPEARISIGVWDEIGREAGFKILTDVHPVAQPN
jgi:hypothetical protein